MFESTGMENKVGSRDSNFKAELEGYFTRLVSLMKADQGDKLQAQADGLNQNLTKAVEMLQGEEQSPIFWFTLPSLLAMLSNLCHFQRTAFIDVYKRQMNKSIIILF